MKDFVFFQKEGETGVALTSTSANYIANLAKEYIQSVETQLNNIVYYDTEVTLIGTSNSTLLGRGISMTDFDSIPDKLQQIANAKSLIAWLREAIKAKENLLKEVQDKSVEEWCKEMGREDPTSGFKKPSILTEKEYYSSLEVKERNRYYQLETEAAVLGKFIHPDGYLANARIKLKTKIQHKHEVSGTGRDALIYTYTPTVNEIDVDTAFYALQKKHREVQAQLNSIKHACEEAIVASKNKVTAECKAAIEEYKVKQEEELAAYHSWVDEKTQEYSKLKIIIPNSLLGIYNLVNSLGK